MLSQSAQLFSYKCSYLSYSLSRRFSSFSRVVGSSIQVSNHQPPKIRIPVSDSQHYDFTLQENETVKQFEDKVKKNAGSLSNFRVITNAKAAHDSLLIQDLIRSKFQIEVNKKPYNVYPLFENMVNKPANEETRRIIDNAFEGRSVPIARRVILYHYFDSLINKLKAQGQSANKEALDQSLEQALADYTKDYQAKLY